MTNKYEILLTIEDIRNQLELLQTQIEHLEVGKVEKKLTGWIGGKPMLVGEYETCTVARPQCIQKRWWNGQVWSAGYEDFFSDNHRMHARSSPMPIRYNELIRYRGFTTKQE
jgi:hypothetical protein